MGKINLTDAQWEQIRPLVEDTGGRPFSHDPRNLINGVLYQYHTKCSWRDLPTIYAHGEHGWESVFHAKQRMEETGILAKIKKIVGVQ
jgi:transposase